MQALDVVANNIANTGTLGFKADHTFQSALKNATNSTSHVTSAYTDFSQGTIQSTGKPSDLALGGPGLFIVEGKSGPLYTRNGNFQISPGGELITSEGYKLLGESGGPIKVSATRPFEIRPDGTVRQDGADAGKIAVVEFPANAGPLKQGGSYYRLAEGQPAPKPASAQVLQASLESSNVNAAEASVEMISIMRQFESLQKALSMQGEMDKRTLDGAGRNAGG